MTKTQTNQDVVQTLANDKVDYIRKTVVAPPLDDKLQKLVLDAILETMDEKSSS